MMKARRAAGSMPPYLVRGDRNECGVALNNWRTEDSMNGKVVVDCIDAAYASIRQHADEIMVLDQTIGDGDHVFNLIRGLEALRGIRADIEVLDSGPALKLAAKKVLSTV